MASRRLHLVVDPDLGPALWVREQTRPGRSRASEDLAGLREQAPAPLAHALSAAPAQLRHRVRLFGPGSGSARRVPALPLPGSELTELTEAVSELLRARFGEGTLEQVAQLVADGAGARLTTDPAHEGEELAAMPDRSEEHTSELQSRGHLVCRLLLEKKNNDAETMIREEI